MEFQQKANKQTKKPRIFATEFLHTNAEHNINAQIPIAHIIKD